MLRYLVAVGAVLSVAACAPTVYNHPSKTQADYNRDLYDCEQSASAKTRNDGFGNNPLITGDNIRDCMVRKYGYSIGGPAYKDASPPVQYVGCKKEDGTIMKIPASFCTPSVGTVVY